MRRRRNFTPQPLLFVPTELPISKWYDRFGGLVFGAMVVALPLFLVAMAWFSTRGVGELIGEVARRISAVMP